MADSVLDFAGLESEGTQGTETTVETSSSVESSPENHESQQQGTESGEPSGGTEKFSGKAIRDAINQAAQQFPEQAKLFKMLADNHFRVANGYQSHFPTPQEAADAKALIEGLGGIDGARGLQDRLAGYDQQEAGLESGDPAVLDSFFKDYPDGAAMLAPHYLERLGKANPDALAQTIAPYALGMLANAGIDGHLAQMLQESDPARLKSMAQQLADWFKGQQTNVQQFKTQQKPQADPLKADREKLSQEREELFNQGVQSKLNDSISPVLKTVIDQYAKTYNLNEAQTKRFQQVLLSDVKEAMNGDKTYKAQVDLRYAAKTRTHDSIASYIAGEFNRRVKDMALGTAQSLFGNAPGAKQTTGTPKAGGPKTAQNGAPLKLSQRPADSELDLNRPDAEMNLIMGRGWTKAGKFVTWR